MNWRAILLVPALLWHQNNAELAHEIRLVGQAEMFHDLAIYHPVQVHYRQLKLHVGCRNTLNLSPVSPLICPNRYHIFPFRNNVVEHVTAIRKSREKGAAELLKARPVQRCGR